MAKNIQNNSEAERLSDACFSYLVADPNELNNFMNQTGYSADFIRNNTDSASLRIGLLDYFASNEAALMSMCATSGIRANEFMNVWHRLQHNRS